MSELFDDLIRELEAKMQRQLLIHNVSERLLLLGIEIGQRKPLDPKERQRYANTLSTARFAVTAEETLDPDHPMRAHVEQALDGTLVDWLALAPALKSTLEEWSGEPIEEDFDEPSPEDINILREQVREIARRRGQSLTEEEFERLVQKIRFPFDRP